MKKLAVTALTAIFLATASLPAQAAPASVGWWNTNHDRWMDDYYSLYGSNKGGPDENAFRTYLHALIAYAEGISDAIKVGSIGDADTLKYAYNTLSMEEQYMNMNAKLATDHDSIELLRQAREAVANAKTAIKTAWKGLGLDISDLTSDVKVHSRDNPTTIGTRQPGR